MSESLNLAAVEMRLKETRSLASISAHEWDALHEDGAVLLAHCRALRAALREALTLSPSHPFFPNAHAIHERAAAVLAQVKDE